MPSFTAPSGKVYQWDKPTPPTQADIDAIVAFDAQSSPSKSEQKPQQAAPQSDSGLPRFDPSMALDGGAMFMQAPNEQEQAQLRGQMANAVRYGGGAAATAAAAPLVATAGMTTLGATAFLAGVNAVSTGFFSALADAMEGKKFDFKGNMSDATIALAPILQNGSKLARTGFNVTGGIIASETARKIRGEQGNDVMSRWVAPIGLTGALSAISGQGQKLANAGERAAALTAERMGGSVMLSDLFPGLTKFEARRIQDSNGRALEALRNMDANIGAVVGQAFQNVPETGRLASSLQENVGKLSRTQKAYQDALAAQQEAFLALDQARNTAAADLPAMKAKAASAALETTKAKLLHQEGVRTLFGGVLPDLGKIAEGSRIQLAQESAKAAKEASAAAIGELYGKAGIGPNTPVVTLEGVLKRIEGQAGAGGALEGDIARKETIDAIARAFQKNKVETAQTLSETGQAVAQPTYLSLEGYRRLRDDIASDLVAQGKDPRAANRVAASAYSAVKGASDDYIATHLKEQFPAWTAAQNAFAREINARQSGAIDMLVDGKASQLYDKVLKEGAGTVFSDLQEYANIIAASADKANPQSIANSEAAANAFKANINALIRDTAIDRAANRMIGFNDSRIYDFGKLSGELSALASKGFPVEQLGFGNRSQIQALSRIGATANAGGYTASELNSFLNDIKDVGADVAAARVEYNRVLLSEQVNAGIGRTNEFVAKKEALLKAAKMTQADAQAAFNAIKDDPLVQLLNNTDMKLSRDPVDNGRWVNKLLTLEPTSVRDFMGALKASNRGLEAEKIKTAAVASVMNGFLGGVDEQGKQILKTPELLALFRESTFGPSNRAQEALKSIIGDMEFRGLKTRFADPLDRISKTKAAIDAIDSTGIPGLFGQARLQSPVAGGVGKVQGGVQTIGLKQALDFVQNRRYNMLYRLYVDPKIAPKFADAGYSIDKFLSQNPVNQTILRLAADADEGK